jgi:cephalosporin-C deacetylase-like acetyl esterase
MEMLTMHYRMALALMFSCSALTSAQPKPAAEPKPGDRMIEAYLARETDKISQKVFAGATTLAEWEQRRPELKRQYLDMLGLWPLPEKTPLHATVTGKLERDDFVVEKVHFQSKPGLYVTGNLYRPARVEGKLPAVLYVCGHSGRGRDGNKTAFQDHGMWFAKNGYVCLVIDTLQLGEIPGIHHGTYGIRGKEPVETRFWWQALGYTPAGVECWNGVRAIDYLVSRPDVDPERIAVTGISGGGAATFWIAAADERVKCAVPVSGMSDLESYVKNKVINGHCDCMFLVNTYQWEWTTIAALVAPRPLLFANSDKDPIFPMDGNRRIIDRLRKLYGMYGKPELVDDHVSIGGHDYRPDLRIAIFKWINKHIKNDTGPITDSADFKLFKGEELRVFAEDNDLPRDALNGKIDETFVKRAEVKLPEEGKFEEWKKGLMKELREKAFRAFPERIPEAQLDFIAGSGGIGDSFFKTEPEILSSTSTWLFEKKTRVGRQTLLLRKQDDPPIPDWAKGLDVEGSQRVNQLRSFDDGAWTRKSPPNYVERAHALLGRTVDEGGVWDIAATVRSTNRRDDNKGIQRVMGRGQAGILAAYAALFEPSITEVVIVDPPASHRDGPYFLNVLRVLDIPDALGMLAPRKVTLVNAKDKAFDKTVEIYRRAGAADKIARK